MTSAPGAHVGVGDYAVERVPDPTGAVRQFGRLRRRRNRSEYEDLLLGQQDVVTDLAVGRDIVAAVRADLNSPRGAP